MLDSIPAFEGTSTLRSEPAFGSGRLDFLIDRRIYIEVKSPLQIINIDMPIPVAKHSGTYGVSRMVRQVEELTDGLGEGESALMIMAFCYDNPGFHPPMYDSDESRHIQRVMKRAHESGLQRWQVNFELTPDWVRVSHIERLV